MTLNPAAWRRLWPKFARRGNPEDWFQKISNHYNQPHRHYHNSQHINDCLRELDLVLNRAPNPVELELAIWLHDVIYDPHRADNEDQSKTFAAQLLADANADQTLTTHVLALIDQTKHNAIPTDETSQYMIDIDLAILGQNPERFWQYEKQIRAEYSFVPEETFRPKRAEILERFLARPRIYNTDFFCDRCESQARSNLAASIKFLRGH